MILTRIWWGLVELGFRLLYNELAWTYDLVSWTVSLGAWRAWQRSALRFLAVPPGSPVLEIAHGTGNFQIDLRTAGLEPIGLDLSPYMGRIARRKLRRHGLAARLTRGCGEALPFPAESFPAVVSTFPTPFITEPETLREIYRVLQPGGRLVIVANGLLTGGVLGRILEWTYRITGQRGPWPDAFAARFGEAGFRLYEARVRLDRSVAIVIICQK